MPGSICYHAPAKLNLALAVGTPDEDGMHPICSWMVTVDLCDELFLTRLLPGTLSRYAIIWHPSAKRRTEIDWSITKDLSVRAHLALQKETGQDLPVQMKLEKRIPVGGGLGGGSSDAATMLRGLNELYELGMSNEVLTAIGRGLGSDVPFLIRGGSAIVQGMGDEITHHDTAPDLQAVIAFPDFSCQTPLVYKRFDELIEGHNHVLRSDDVYSLAGDSGGGTSQPDSKGLFNDLTAAAILAAPKLQEMIGQISELAERPAHVSGSGSSLFVICDDPLHAESLASIVEKRLNLPAVAVKAHEITESSIVGDKE